MNNQLIKYVHGRRGRLIGVVAATKIPGCEDVFITGSLCHRKKDKYAEAIALGLANDRALLMSTDKRPCALPFSLRNEVEKMADRAHRYFKGANVILPTIKGQGPKGAADILR